MAIDFTGINQRFAAGSAGWMFLLKERLKANGGVVTQSGDGTTFFPSSDGITSAGSGAGGMNNSRAWFVVLYGTRRWCFQRGTVNTGLRWKYSHNAAYNAGSPSATVTPTLTIAADDKVLSGGGTDASPTFAVMASNSTVPYRGHVWVETGKKGFLVALYSDGGGNFTHGLYSEEMLASTFHPADTDPWVHYASLTSPFEVTDLTSEGANAPIGYLGRGTAGETFARMSMADLRIGTGGSIVHAVGSRTTDGSDAALPIFYMRRSPQAGWKGQSRFFRWVSTGRPPNGLFGARERLVINHVDTFWDGVSVPRI